MSFRLLAKLVPITAIALLASVLPSAAAPDIKALGGFEISEGEFRAAFQTGDKEHVVLDDKVACHGKKSLRLTNPDGGTYDASITIPVRPMNGPAILDISVMVKADKIELGNLGFLSARCYAHGLDEDGKALPFHDLGDCYYGTFDWRRAERLINIPQGAQALKIVMSLNGCRGTAWFDDISVVDKTDVWRKPESDSAVISINPKRKLGRMTNGFGWSWETVSPERYSEAEMSTWDRLFAKMDYDGTDWIRAGVLHAFYAPSNYEAGKDDGREYDYVVDNRYTRQLCRLLEHCEKRGITVLLTNWCADGYYADIPNCQWLCTGCHWYPSRHDDPDWKLAYSDERFIEGLCDMVKYLKVDRNFTCIKYLSFWNEPDGTWYLPGYKSRFFRVYDLLDARLRKLGLRDQVEILGPENAEGGTAAVRMARDVVDMGNQIDVAAIHDYTSGLPAPTELTSQYHNQHYADTFVEVNKILRKSKCVKTPILFTEIGSFGSDLYTEKRMHYLCTLGIADYIIRCIKAGVGGFLRWQYNDLGDSQFEPFKLVDGRLVTDDALYWGYAVLTRWTTPNSTILDTEVTGSEDGFGIKRVAAVALKAPSGFVSVLIVNSGRSPKRITLNFTEPQEGFWRRYYYDASLPISIQEGAVCKASATEFVFDVPAESVNVVTDCAIGLSGNAPR